MKKKNVLFVIMLFSVMAFAQDLPKIAVYVTGDVPENERAALGTRILASLVNSGRYMGIERGESFLAEVNREHIKQRSGAIDDSQISALGKQFGVKYVCVAAITPAFGAFQVSARIIDVETAQVVFIGESNRPLDNMDDFAWVSDEVVHIMFGGEPRVRPTLGAKRKSGMSIGAGGFFSSDLGGGIKLSSGATVKMPYTGGGAHLFFDAYYAKVIIGYSAGGGRWKGFVEPDVKRTSVNIGAYAKYPQFDFRLIQAFPLLGVEYEASVSGKMIRDGGSEVIFDGREERPKSSDLSELWIRFGGGANIDMSESLFLRTEFLYGLRTAAAHEKSLGENTLPGHGPIVRVGAGFRF